jgi:hypothetical protein
MLLGVVVLATLPACRDRKKEAALLLPGTLERLLPLVDRDVKQVRSGLPKVAAQLPRYLDTDPGADLAGLKRALSGVRGRVYELAAAKTTFLVFVDDKGVVVRGENDPDLAAGKSLVEPLPKMKALLSQSKGLVETLGYMHGLRGVQKGGDLQWVVGTAVIAKGGERQGSLVTGWSFRRYAALLEDNARHHAKKQAEKRSRQHPLIYVFFLHGDKAFGGPISPDVLGNALAARGLPAKLQADKVLQLAVRVEERDFAVAVRAMPEFGGDVALAVMLSVF